MTISSSSIELGLDHFHFSPCSSRRSSIGADLTLTNWLYVLHTGADIGAIRYVLAGGLYHDENARPSNVKILIVQGTQHRYSKQQCDTHHACASG